MPVSGSNPGLSTERLDTLNATPYAVKAKPDIFETAFFTGTHVTEDSVLLRFYTVNIGKIYIQSGKMIACDPIVMQDAKPFTQVFPLGEYPVHLAIAKINNDERVAFSRILFSDKPVVKWEFAVPEGQKPMDIFGDSSYAYSVDGGIGLFIDGKANAAFDSLRKADGRLWEQVFIVEMGKHAHSSWEYLLYNFGRPNLAVFTTGFGDGRYSTYVGYDDGGQPCRLLTDFGLVNWWKK